MATHTDDLANRVSELEKTVQHLESQLVDMAKVVDMIIDGRSEVAADELCKLVRRLVGGPSHGG